MTTKGSIGRLLSFGLLLLSLCSLASAQFSLTTTNAGGNSSQGNMFDVKALSGNVLISSFDVHVSGTHTVEIWYYTAGGSYGPWYNAGTGSQSDWTLLQTAQITGVSGTLTAMPALSTPFLIIGGQTQAFYVRSTTGSLTYTGTSTGPTPFPPFTSAASDSFLEIFWGHGGSFPFPVNYTREWNGTIHYTVSSVSDDLAVTDISAPAGDAPGCNLLSSTETVTAQVFNLGMNPVPGSTLVTLDLYVDGVFVTTEFASTPAMPMNLGDSFNYSFLTTVDLSAPMTHSVSVTVTYPGDLDPSNDTRVENFSSGGATRITSFPYVENFDAAASDNTTTPPGGWLQDTADGTGTNSDWYFRTTPTPSQPGPTADHTTGSGYYAYVEDASSFTQVNLISPCLDLSTMIAPAMNYWMFSDNPTAPTNDNLLSVDVISYPGGLVTTNVDGPVASQNVGWTLRSVNLSAFFGQTIQVVFRGQSSGGGSTHDIAIDDVSIFDPLPTIGQAPQAGVAILDINNALNINTQPALPGFGGPFYANAAVGSVMGIKISGESNAPILFLAGALNPVAATYPNIGQLDIGGAYNVGTGYPDNLVVIADGFNPTTFVNAVFNTGPAGLLDIGFQIPPFPLGVLAGFQAALATTNGFFFALSNAVEVTII